VGKSIAVTLLDMWELNPISRCARLWRVFSTRFVGFSPSGLICGCAGCPTATRRPWLSAGKSCDRSRKNCDIFLREWLKLRLMATGKYNPLSIEKV
jgi:hypothetical protein